MISKPKDQAPRPRVAGVTAPLFSLWTAQSAGLGDIADLPPTARWLADAGFGLLQLLPLAELSRWSDSPYSARAAFGLDPIYVSGTWLDEQVPGTQADAPPRPTDDGPIDYGRARTYKEALLAAAFARFRRAGADADLAAFRERHRDWLEPLALYGALKDRVGDVGWWDWPTGLAAREPEALARARAEHRDAIDYHAFKQWILHTQWARARRELAAMGVALMGDLPFSVTADSVDVWRERALFRRDRSLGAPGDQFNEDGQDWMLPAYNWERLAATDYAWMRRRVRYAGLLFDRVRVDHLVGLFRSYTRPMEDLRDDDGRLVPGAFDPADPAAQEAQGARVLAAMIESAAAEGATLVAEDLGCIPDYVPEAMARLELPGYRVLIWEKDGEAFRDPREYPTRSVACFSTHDTAPVTAWYESLGVDERAELHALCERSVGAPIVLDDAALSSFSPAVHGALLKLLQGSSSELTLLLIQELYASAERINTPATVGPHNWRYRLPAPLELLREQPAIKRALARCRQAVVDAGRAPARA